ncbi:hypothetical protein G3N18_14915, partial [Microbacterium sp. 2C]|nr:hypothetical protein [Microbacterium paulum]
EGRRASARREGPTDATRLRRDEDESVTTPPGSARRVWPWVLAVVAGVVAVAAVALIVVVLGSGLR